MSFYPYAFTTPIVHHMVGTYKYTVVFLAAELHDELPLDTYPRLRVSGEVGGQPFEGAWQPVRGRWYLMLSKGLLRNGGMEIGDEVEVRFLVEDQDAVSVPTALRRALREESAAEAAWQELTAGKQRALAHRVASAKTEPTRMRRVAEVIAALHGEDTSLNRILGRR